MSKRKLPSGTGRDAMNRAEQALQRQQSMRQLEGYRKAKAEQSFWEREHRRRSIMAPMFEKRDRERSGK